MTKKTIKLIEEQINKELYSAYLYYDIAEYYRAKGLDGLHTHFEAQAQEEIEHAEKFAEYLHDMEVSFKLLPIDAPDNDFKDLREPLALQVTHEKYVTELICGIEKQAEKDGDSQTKNFIQWYVTEQMEEEKHSKEMLDKYDLFAKDGGYALYMYDKEFAAK